jgi:hypothetical protein
VPSRNSVLKTRANEGQRGGGNEEEEGGRPGLARPSRKKKPVIGKSSLNALNDRFPLEEKKPRGEENSPLTLCRAARRILTIGKIFRGSWRSTRVISMPWCWRYYCPRRYRCPGAQALSRRGWRRGGWRRRGWRYCSARATTGL